MKNKSNVFLFLADPRNKNQNMIPAGPDREIKIRTRSPPGRPAKKNQNMIPARPAREKKIRTRSPPGRPAENQNMIPARPAREKKSEHDPGQPAPRKKSEHDTWPGRLPRPDRVLIFIWAKNPRRGFLARIQEACCSLRPVSPRLAGEPRLAKGSPKARQGSPEARQGSPEARQARLAKGSPRLAKN